MITCHVLGKQGQRNSSRSVSDSVLDSFCSITLPTHDAGLVSLSLISEHNLKTVMGLAWCNMSNLVQLEQMASWPQGIQK